MFSYAGRSSKHRFKDSIQGFSKILREAFWTTLIEHSFLHAQIRDVAIFSQAVSWEVVQDQPLLDIQGKLIHIFYLPAVR